MDYTDEQLDVTTSIYPESITKVFDAHGGVDTWNAMQSLVFTMKKPNGDEVTTTDLKNRTSIIEMPKHTIGFNGKDVWLTSKDTTAYKGNPKFYYNLMFYFYAMPFVLADDGIMYEETTPLVFEGQTYPGIKIGYEAGIGESPEDEYILYYNPETYKMEWLGYTVTFFSKEKSKEFHFIKYSNWQTVNGLLLPETLTWYKYENNLPTEKRNDLKFTDVKLSKEKLDASIFEIKEGATVVE
ncbi:hypothetical protein JCM19301_3201 [Jejuia pallidilutea]|uniref:Uncharacterized protein n=1 Tax=Jejuia pallidilutea TaxID=504487 RepID=A0A090WRI2_9FLAO|nr:hypothetical protein JCM19301_3201 [Jejuia pallidilutea]GAL69987.1 hypothetical protein JCM19302_882 [Jejuia pallidilutea]GAL90986.1 hypothetical protein JCM19538_1044 [Jejuia pallidilutea]